MPDTKPKSNGFRPIIERDANGIPYRIRFTESQPDRKPIPDAILGTYTVLDPRFPKR